MGKASLAVATVLVLVGLLWILQGIGYVGGSFMTGDSHWTWIGTVTALVGAALLVWRSVR